MYLKFTRNILTFISLSLTLSSSMPLRRRIATALLLSALRCRVASSLSSLVWYSLASLPSLFSYFKPSLNFEYHYPRCSVIRCLCLNHLHGWVCMNVDFSYFITHFGYMGVSRVLICKTLPGNLIFKLWGHNLVLGISFTLFEPVQMGIGCPAVEK